MIRESNRHRGFATVIALVAVGLIGVTLAGLAARLSMESHRTTRELEDAQLRQIVFAAQMQTQGVTQSTKINLPPQLSGDGYSVTVQIESRHGKTTAQVRPSKRPKSY
jgi:type II secretory pathway component PulK